MNAVWMVGVLLAGALLIPRLCKIFSRQLNRRLARKLAEGPVGALMRYDYDYAMALSQEVFTGELNAEEAHQIADRFLRRVIGSRLGMELRDTGIDPLPRLNQGSVR